MCSQIIIQETCLWNDCLDSSVRWIVLVLTTLYNKQRKHSYILYQLPCRNCDWNHFPSHSDLISAFLWWLWFVHKFSHKVINISMQYIIVNHPNASKNHAIISQIYLNTFHTTFCTFLLNIAMWHTCLIK